MSHISLKSIEKIIMILLGNLLYSFAIAFSYFQAGLSQAEPQVSHFL